MKTHNRNILIIALIALVNMLGYGIIIPILYSYSKRFGLSDFQNGLLFASYSICQFISTPIIGRLSDRFGRKPLLLTSITGTAVSFFIMAFAPNAFFLFVARILDGLTAGNIPVAFAVVSDTTKPEERPRAFGFIGSAFNFGFVFGPAISAFTIGISESLPFIIAGVITLIAVTLTALYLPETNSHMGETSKGKLIDIPRLWHTLFDPQLGTIFLITLLYFLAFSAAIIYGFQPFTMNVLHMTQSQNAQLFTLFGTVGLISQSFLVQRIAKAFGMKQPFIISMALTGLAFLAMFVSASVPLFVAGMIVLSFSNSVIQTLIPTILSDVTDERSQGSIMGLNTSYQSIGMIFGPIIGGGVATLAIRYPFLLGAALILPNIFLTFRILAGPRHPDSAFGSDAPAAGA